MTSKRNQWKGLALFTVAAIATIFTSTLSQATLVKAQEIIEPTIENRLAKVRERFKQIRRESDTLLTKRKEQTNHHLWQKRV